MSEERTKPEFDAPSGPAPADLVVRDIIVGDGDEAKPGDTVTVLGNPDRDDAHFMYLLDVKFASGKNWTRSEQIPE